MRLPRGCGSACPRLLVSLHGCVIHCWTCSAVECDASCLRRGSFAIGVALISCARIGQAPTGAHLPSQAVQTVIPSPSKLFLLSKRPLQLGHASTQANLTLVCRSLLSMPRTRPYSESTPMSSSLLHDGSGAMNNTALGSSQNASRCWCRFRLSKWIIRSLCTRSNMSDIFWSTCISRSVFNVDRGGRERERARESRERAERQERGEKGREELSTEACQCSSAHNRDWKPSICAPCSH